MGSSRYAFFALLTAFFHTALLCVYQYVAPTIAPASGPYALVFANLVHFFFETPKTYHFQLLGALELSDKSFAYLLAIQLACSSPPRSLPSLAAGVIAGLLYRVPAIRSRADFPDGLISACSTYVLPLLGTGQRGASRTRRGYDRVRPVGVMDPAEGTVSQHHIETLEAMGFSQEDSAAALRRHHDDVHRATEQLLGTSA
ncbi:unnamed protein product [Chondrus crispus]|uniref:UBA domain-containing protein n=1 Tax=Chondrus crispus TaxID=2769 RepID=S0F3I4_CHOCR|nr:unnamed protein product [Chondrus crispus]CDF77424.1 unnamed protein product [Chondrus crispus]|eukprot:XP_005712298.1 unnamed protein product [Chondrus crispus]